MLTYISRHPGLTFQQDNDCPYTTGSSYWLSFCFPNIALASKVVRNLPHSERLEHYGQVPPTSSGIRRSNEPISQNLIEYTAGEYPPTLSVSAKPNNRLHQCQRLTNALLNRSFCEPLSLEKIIQFCNYLFFCTCTSHLPIFVPLG